MNETIQEKRMNGRYSYDSFFTCTMMGDASHPPSISPLHGKIRDVSNSGMGITIETDLTPGAVVLARIPVAGTDASIPALAAVKWSKQNGKGYYAGLKFVME
jgi:hypothetical protein